MSRIPSIRCPRCRKANYILSKMCECGVHLTSESSVLVDSSEIAGVDFDNTIYSKIKTVTCPNCNKNNYAFPREKDVVICRHCYINIPKYIKITEQKMAEQPIDQSTIVADIEPKPTAAPTPKPTTAPTPKPMVAPVTHPTKPKREIRVSKLKPPAAPAIKPSAAPATNLPLPKTIIFTRVDTSESLSIEPSAAPGGKIVPIGRAGIFGRFFNNDAHIGREHCVLEYDPSFGWRLKNKNDANGRCRLTYLKSEKNKWKLMPPDTLFTLKNNNELQIGTGDHKFEFKIKIL